MIEPIERLTFDPERLQRDHPPRLRHPHKQLLYEIACGLGRPPAGTIVYSRWPALRLPSQAAPAEAVPRVEPRQDVYDYVPAAPLLNGQMSAYNGRL